jgi:hypothetical protein
MEPFYPLHALACEECWLVQLEEFEAPEKIFTEDYAYFSSFSTSWLDHCRAYCEMIAARLKLGPQSFVVEIASNDGYLLQNFVRLGIPSLGIEPSAKIVEAAKEKGVESWVAFFNKQTAADLVSKRGKADLLLGNNVLAHVPALKDFVGALKIALADDGVITLEFPHLLSIVESTQFDTIYHEHFSYFSLLALQKVFNSQGLRIFDVERLSTHGGSLRIYANHQSSNRFAEGPAIAELIAVEKKAGLDKPSTYLSFAERVDVVKRNLLDFLIRAKRDGATVVGYGAAAKGNTLLNYCGIRQDFLDFSVDRSPHKQGMFLPGTRIPILAPEKIHEVKPDYLLILPWNLKDEVMKQMSDVRAWGCKFVVPIPKLEVID